MKKQENDEKTRNKFKYIYILFILNSEVKQGQKSRFMGFRQVDSEHGNKWGDSLLELTAATVGCFGEMADVLGSLNFHVLVVQME